MTNDQKTKPAGFDAAKKHIPSLFPYLRRFRVGLGFGTFCVLATAVAANVVPLIVNWTIKYIAAESSTLGIRGSLLVLQTLFAAPSHLLAMMPWIWKIQEGTVDSWIAPPTPEGHSLHWYFLGILAFAMISGIFRFLQRRVLIGISREIEFDLRNDLFAHLLRMPPAFFDRMTTGDIVARATNDLNQVRSMLGPGLMYPVNAVLMMVFALAGMLYLSPFMTLVALFPPFVMAVGTNRIAKTLHERFTRVQEQYSQISSKVQENLTGIRVVKAYVREKAEVGVIRDLNQEYLERNLRYFRTMGFLHPFFSFSHNLGRFVVLTVGGYLIMSPRYRFDVGDLAAFFLYLNMLQFPMISVGWVLNVIQRGVASLVRINEVLHAEPEIHDPDTPVNPEGIRGEIVFRNVSFAYRPGQPVLHAINIEARPGTVLGIVGATGAGKSSLTHLIPRFYDPTEGEILLDGVPLDSYRLTDLRRSIGLVSQDHFIFSSTVGKNIGFGLPPDEYIEESIQEASRMAAFHESVLEFPNGYDTIVGERGVTLSGGQKQRAAIARALAIDPKVLILDDALSAVDTQTEEKILGSLRAVMRERTTLLISHRISTVRAADWIIVLERGRIVEEGTHDDLVALGSVYATLYRQQQLEEEIEEMTA